MNHLAYGAAGSEKFITNVGLITSNGSHGPNIMAASWTHHVSYEPALVLVCIEPDDATLENIIDTKVFGIGLASDQQNVLASIAGSYSGRTVDKVSLLKELGFEFHEGAKTKTPVVAGAALNMELKLVTHDSVGSHDILIGKVLASSVNKSAEPVAYSRGRYRKLGHDIEKPEQEALDKIASLAEKHRKS